MYVSRKLCKKNQSTHAPPRRITGGGGCMSPGIRFLVLSYDTYSACYVSVGPRGTFVMLHTAVGDPSFIFPHSVWDRKSCSPLIPSRSAVIS